MKAVICTKYGGSEVLKIREVNKPIPKENEILIKIKAVSLSQVDCTFRKGKPFISRLFTGILKPKRSIPGDVISGEIEEIGKNIKKFAVGENIFGHTGLTLGGNAEYICLKEDEALIVKPDNMSHLEAAAIAYSGITALPFILEHSEIKKGDRVLVNGASGAIGSFAVQMAKSLGAEVVGVDN